MHRPGRAILPAVALAAFVVVLGGAVLVLRPAAHRSVPVAASKAGAPARPAQSPAELLATLPDGIDLAVIVDGASDLRSSTVGAAAIRLMADAGALTDLDTAWSALSGRLGWSRDEAFDRLLGRRVVLVSRAVEGTEERRWAILSEVTPDTESRLRERLEAAPRSIDQGHQILSLEKGQYELTAHRAAAAGGQAGDAGPVTLVFGPAGRGELFDEMVGVLARGADHPLGARDVRTQALALGDCEILVAASFNRRPPAGPGEDAGRVPWTDFVLLASGRDDSSLRVCPVSAPECAWRSRVLVRDTSRREALRRVDLSTDAAFRALSAGSLAAVVQNAALPAVLGPSAPLESVLGWLPLPPSARTLVDGPQAVALRASGPGGLISATAALRTPSTRALAEVLDGSVARGVGAFEQRLGVTAAVAPDFEGVAPGAVRVVGVSAPPTGPLSILTSRPLTVAWAYPSRPGANGPYNRAHPTCPAAQLTAAEAQAIAAPAAQLTGTDASTPDRPGWWVLSVCQTDPANTTAPTGAGVSPVSATPVEPAPTPAEVVRGEANALLSDTSEAEQARWVFLASARPAAIEALLPSAVPDIRGIRSILKRFDDVGLRLHITEEGDILGDLSFRLTPAAGTEQAARP